MHKHIFWTILLIVVLNSSYRITKADQQPISKIVLLDKLQNKYNCFLQAWVFSDGY